MDSAHSLNAHPYFRIRLLKIECDSVFLAVRIIQFLITCIQIRMFALIFLQQTAAQGSAESSWVKHVRSPWRYRVKFSIFYMKSLNCIPSSASLRILAVPNWEPENCELRISLRICKNLPNLLFLCKWAHMGWNDSLTEVRILWHCTCYIRKVILFNDNIFLAKKQ